MTVHMHVFESVSACVYEIDGICRDTVICSIWIASIMECLYSVSR